ncbi:30S ribosomal protein S31, mitochondrial [Argentina anserina]|uniref:30S ribosomal protein S31, mitochondrial n=1 Tax=Argentina anserina TaxID=57926 RepID=UPI002176535C|nr:30S ribosomal protein S31, mitochondrial [Potentilla anserina]
MAMAQSCAAAARRVLAREQRALFTTASSSTSSFSAAAQFGAPMLCGRGDKKTKKGKRFKGSFGNARPKKEKMIERIKDKVEVPRSTPWPLPFKLI